MPATLAGKSRRPQRKRQQDSSNADLQQLGRLLDEGRAAAAYDRLLRALAGVPAASLDAIMVGREDPPAAASARQAVRVTSWLLGVPKRRAAEILGASGSRISRNDAIDRAMLDRLQALAQLWSRISRVVGREGAAAWFQEANPGLDGETPLALFGTSYGREKIAALITSILYGDVI